LDDRVLAAIRAGVKRRHSIFLNVANALPIEKHEITASLQRLRKAGRIRCNIYTGEWVVETNKRVNDLSEQVAIAIDLIRRVQFVAGREPRKDEDNVAPAFHLANDIGHPLYLRMFQKQGISSAKVAAAVRAGVLRVIEVQS
jgi:hypothetical protein